MAPPTWCSEPDRPRKAPGRVHARLANRWLARRVRRRYAYPLTDLGPCGRPRRDRLLALGLVDRRSGWPLEMVLRAGNAGWRVGEVPSPTGPGPVGPR